MSIKIGETNNKILLLSASGFGNLGDEAILSANLDFFKLNNIVTGDRIAVLSFSPSDTISIHQTNALEDLNKLFTYEIDSHRFKIVKIIFICLLLFRLLLNVECLNRKKPILLLNKTEFNFLQSLSNCSVLLVVGGGNLNDNFALMGLFTRYCTCLIAKRLNKPVLLGGQTIGPLQTYFNREIAKRLLDMVDLVTIRETLSLDILKDINCNPKCLKIVMDDAFYIKSLSPSDSFDILLSEGINLNEVRKRDKLIVAVNVRAWWKMDSQNDELKEFLKYMIHNLIGDGRYFLLFVPTAFSQHSGWKDVESAKEFVSHEVNQNNFFILTKSHTWSEIKGILGLVDAAIGTSFHFNVFSISNGTPSIGLYSDEYSKLRIGGLYKLLGLDDLAIYINNINNEECMVNLEKFLYQNNEIKSIIHERIKNLHYESCFAAKEALKIIGGINE